MASSNNANWYNNLNYAVSPNNCYHVVVTTNTSSNTIKLFINGQLVDSYSNTLGGWNAYDYLGVADHPGASMYYYFTGVLDDLIYWNRTLSDTEAQSVYSDIYSFGEMQRLS